MFFLTITQGTVKTRGPLLKTLFPQMIRNRLSINYKFHKYHKHHFINIWKASLKDRWMDRRLQRCTRQQYYETVLSAFLARRKHIHFIVAIDASLACCAAVSRQAENQIYLITSFPSYSSFLVCSPCLVSKCLTIRRLYITITGKSAGAMHVCYKLEKNIATQYFSYKTLY